MHQSQQATSAVVKKVVTRLVEAKNAVLHIHTHNCTNDNANMANFFHDLLLQKP